MIDRLIRHLRQGNLIQRVREEPVRRRKRRWAKLSNGVTEVEFELFPKVRMLLPVDSRLSAAIFCGDFEATELKFVRSILREDDVFFDIGSNIGLFSLAAASRITSGRIYAFEPTPRVFDTLVRNCQLNGFAQIVPFRLALSNANGVLQLVDKADGLDAWNSVRAQNQDDAAGSAVQCMTLDSFIEREQIAPARIRLIKIDVEGWERFVLLGGVDLLSRPDAPMLLVEFSSNVMDHTACTCHDLYVQITGLGYRLHSLTDAGTIGAEAPDQEWPYKNLVAMKPAHLA